jgi:hypothetical protein
MAIFWFKEALYNYQHGPMKNDSSNCQIGAVMNIIGSIKY